MGHHSPAATATASFQTLQRAITAVNAQLRAACKATGTATQQSVPVDTLHAQLQRLHTAASVTAGDDLCIALLQAKLAIDWLFTLHRRGAGGACGYLQTLDTFSQGVAWFGGALQLRSLRSCCNTVPEVSGLARLEGALLFVHGAGALVHVHSRRSRRACACRGTCTYRFAQQAENFHAELRADAPSEAQARAEVARCEAALRAALQACLLGRVVSRHLAAIKARLWRPDGRLVQRRLRRDCAAQPPEVIECGTGGYERDQRVAQGAAPVVASCA